MVYQISDFGAAKADFGTDLAISTRSELDPGYSIKKNLDQIKPGNCIIS